MELNSFLTSIADAIRSKKGTTDKINASNFASEIESIEAGGGVVVVDELPTENIQEGVIYQVNEISDIDVYLKDDDKNPGNLENSITLILGITPFLIYEVVDSLPSSPVVSDLQTFSEILVYIFNDTPYVYGNVGYGNMWIDIITLIASVTGITYENKGYVSSADNITEAGLYVKYKKGKQGVLSTGEYDIIVNDSGWNDYKAIFEKTVVEYKNDNIKEIPFSAFYYCEKLETVDIPNVTSILGGAFENCSNLKKLNAPKVESINSGAFYNCGSLKFADFSNVTYIGPSAFENCTSLLKKNQKILPLILPKATIIGDNAFKWLDVYTIILGTNQVCTLGANAIEYANLNHSVPDLRRPKAIYVPDNLVEEYKNATNLSIFAKVIKPLSEYVEE